MKSHHYSQHAAALRTELGSALTREQMQAFHARTGARHLAIAARQFAILALATWGLIAITNPLVWIPLAFVQGFTVFNFTVLLHEVVHHTVFDRRRPAPSARWAGCTPCRAASPRASSRAGTSITTPSSGSDDDDPKRHHLSPKINARWFKLLYASPALFPIYFRAARKESATYPAELQRRIAFERKVSIAAHLTVLALIWTFAGAGAAPRAYIMPVFFIFPIAFTLNRLGQHYDIDPTTPRSGAR